MSRAPITDEELEQWAERRADDAGHLARELVQYRRGGFEMRLCEQAHVVLKPDVVYRFTVDPKCPACLKLAERSAP